MSAAITVNFTDSEALKNATVQALVGALSPELKEELIRKGVESLMLTPPARQGYGYSEPKSPLQEVFETAIRQFARDLAIDMVKGDANLQVKLKEALHGAAEKMFAAQYNLADILGEAFTTALKKDN